MSPLMEKPKLRLKLRSAVTIKIVAHSWHFQPGTGETAVTSLNHPLVLTFVVSDMFPIHLLPPNNIDVARNH